MMLWFPIEQSPHSLADQAELAALADPTHSSSLEDLKGALRQFSLVDEQPAEGVLLAQDDEISIKVDDAVEELNRRGAIIGDGYPFDFDGTVLTASDAWADEAIAYVFLLLLSADGLPGQETGRRLFEEVTTAALAEYLTGKSLRFGFPHRAPVPSHPNDAVDYLAAQIGQPRVDGRRVRKYEKDMGLDAVAWKPFTDGRHTKVVLLANCSTGANWNSKLGELSISKWKRMINFGCDPILVFAVPWIPSHEDWEDIVDYGHIVLDRARVASLLSRWDSGRQVRNWCTQRLREAVSV